MMSSEVFLVLTCVFVLGFDVFLGTECPQNVLQKDNSFIKGYIYVLFDM